MTNFIPIFPLSIVVYPGEELNLHIFEPRYKQLVEECFRQKKPFGIPAVINSQVSERGTVVEITEITNRYEDGKMDIRTRGISIFKILEIVKDIPDKLFSGAIVTYPRTNYSGSANLMKKILKGVREIHSRLNVTKDFKKPDEELNSFDLAHHAGMSIEEEYRLLEFEEELHRQEFLKRHLAKVIPILSDMEVLKGKIKMNGHFKNLEGFQFS